jgi:hypothetical protein
MQGGMALKVQTPSGMMQVTIPNGLRAGQEFHMMVPAPAPPMGQPAYGQPTGQPMGPVMGQVVGAPSQGQPMYPQQQPMYPAQQPQMAQPMMYGQQPQMVQQPMQYPQQPQMMQQPMYYQQQPQQVVVQQQPQVIYQQQPQVIYQQQPQVIHHHVGGGPVYNRGIDGGDGGVGGDALARHRIADLKVRDAVEDDDVGGCHVSLRLSRCGPRLRRIELACGTEVEPQLDRRGASELAEVDVALLTDELPPAAFADSGFLQFLQSDEL